MGGIFDVQSCVVMIDLLTLLSTRPSEHVITVCMLNLATKGAILICHDAIYILLIAESSFCMKTIENGRYSSYLIHHIVLSLTHTQEAKGRKEEGKESTSSICVYTRCFCCVFSMKLLYKRPEKKNCLCSLMVAFN